MIPGIARSIDEGRMNSIALTASSYTTGQSVTWVQAAARGRFSPGRGRSASVGGPICVDHVMASAALPFFFSRGRNRGCLVW